MAEEVPFGLDSPICDTETVAEDTATDCLINTQSVVGPRRVKTKEVEIEAHDPMKLQLLCERVKTKPTRFGQFTGTYVKPKYQDCICEHPRDRE